MGESKCGLGLSGGKKTFTDIGPLKKGVLSSTGYSVKNSLKKRRKTLKKLVSKEGPLKAFRQLNVVSIFNKNVAPTKSQTFKRDRNWIRRTFFNKS
jgi:hypothetical protein